MAIIDKIYDAVDDFGMITSAEARELVQQSRRGKLVRVARGVSACPYGPSRRRPLMPSRSRLLEQALGSLGSPSLPC